MGTNPRIIPDCIANGEAIELQEKTVSLADEDNRAALRKTLNSYKEGKLPDSSDSE